MKSLRFLPALGCLAVSGLAQGPLYTVDPAVQPGMSFNSTLFGRPTTSYASFVDLDGGPRSLAGESFLLGLTPALATIDAGVLTVSGAMRSYTIPVGTTPGVTVYLQSVVLDSGAPNGSFWVTDGESTTIYGSTRVFVENFIDPLAQGYVGDYDQAQRGRLQGTPARRRTVRTIPGGVKFRTPIISPLNPFGERIQMVLRPSDLGATGGEEIVTAVRWLPFASVVQDTYPDISIELAHSTVQPDFTIDPQTALPRFPQSGLSRTFAANVKAGENLVQVFRGPYSFGPQDVRSDGYVSYPVPQQSFVYNGNDSLLLDIKTSPSNASGINGQVVYLQVLTSPRPDARAFALGTAANPVNPHATTQALTGDNSMHDMQIELLKVKSTATSPWRDSGVGGPNYHAPILARSVPAGAAVGVEFRGSDAANGSNPTPWTDNIDQIDGKRFLQLRVALQAPPAGDAMPSLDAIVIPIN